MSRKSKKNISNFLPNFFCDFTFKEIKGEAYKMVICRIVESGGQKEIDEIIRFFCRETVIKGIRDKIYFLSNYASDKVLKFSPEIKKDEIYCDLNRKDKPFHWI